MNALNSAQLNLSSSKMSVFRRKILCFYKNHGRSLPFRRTRNPYRIIVSEIMLHQTQVERVIPKYLSWVRRWPNWKSLAHATWKELLTEWSGLGYNRRACYLGEMAQIIVGQFGGKIPDAPEELRKLPGIGKYTSHAVLIFAHNKRLAAIDTNIRRVLIHELRLPITITDSELESVAWKVLPRSDSRSWHYALMDYGSLALPRRATNVRSKSQQSIFSGSVRQIRGEIIWQLTQKSRVRCLTIARTLQCSEEDVLRAVKALADDGLINIRGSFISLCP